MEFARDVTHSFLLPASRHASDVMLCFAHDVAYLIKAGNFMLEMSPLERTSLSFNDVNSFNSFLDPCGDVWTKFEDYCYHVSGEEMTEEQAQQYCDQKMDANLAKINSQEENNFVLDLANKHASSAKQVWIGLKWKNDPKNYYWYDNSVPTFTNWAPGEPSGKVKEPCVLMLIGQYDMLPVRAAGYWNDVLCDAPHIPAVCKKLY